MSRRPENTRKERCLHQAGPKLALLRKVDFLRYISERLCASRVWNIEDCLGIAPKNMGVAELAPQVGKTLCVEGLSANLDLGFALN